MAIRKIRLEEDPILRKKTRTVDIFDEKLKTLVEDMKDTMYDASGVGLAAPQIGMLKKIFVVDVYDDTGVKVLINPVLIEEKGKEEDVEGCLSIPKKNGIVPRPTYVKFKAQDVDGNFFEIEGEDFLARAFCHEYDHLNGVLYVDRVVKGTLVDEEEE